MWVVRAHMLWAAGPILLCASACGDDAIGVSWTARVPNAALRDEIRGLVGVVHEQGCAGAPMFETPWRPGEQGDPPPPLSPGVYGFEVVALDEACGMVATGCEEVSLESDSSVIVTTLNAAAGPPRCTPDRCDRGVCLPGADGGPPDAGIDAGDPPDAGDDAGNDSGTGPRCPADTIACETFDQTPVGWTLRETGGGTASIAASPTHAGAGSLAISVPSGASAVYVLPLDPPFQERTFFARFHVFLEATPRFDAFAVVLEFLDTASGNKTSFEFESDDRVQVSAAGGEFESSSVDAIPRGQWVCVRFEGRLEAGGGNGFVRVLIEDEPRASTRVGADTLSPNGFDEMRFGVASSPSNPSMQLFLDELVVDEQPVDCLPASP